MTPSAPRRPPAPAPSAEATALPERHASLWLLTGAPATWAVHFLLSYVTVAIWCAKAAAAAAPLGAARVALAVYTAVALGLIAWFGWHGLGKHRWGTAALPHDDATAGDRHRFLGFATLLLSGLSFVAVVYTALAMIVIGTCR